MNAILNEDSIRLLKTLFGYRWDEAWVCWTSNMHGKLVANLVPGDLPDERRLLLLHRRCCARGAEGRKVE